MPESASKTVTKPTPENSGPSTAPTVALAITFGVIAVLSCGVPFVPPLVFIAVPLAGVSLFLIGRVTLRGTRWTKGRAISAALALALDGLALYLALGHHHLIDWFEGHY